MTHLAPVFEAPMRQRFKLEGNWDTWRHETLSSDQSEEFIKTFAAHADGTVFNYIDPPSRLAHEEILNLKHLREHTAKARLLHGQNSSQFQSALTRLMASVKHHFLT